MPKDVPVNSPLHGLPGPIAVRGQLQRLLESQHFSRSRRYTAFLRFVVELTLRGEEQSLRERPIGHAIFDREATYDTNADPIVRITAAEVRKRLAQYYHEPPHEGELRIELLTGTYVPHFYLKEIVRAAEQSLNHSTHLQNEPNVFRVWASAGKSTSNILLCLAVPKSFLGVEPTQGLSLMNWIMDENTVAFSDVLAQDRVIRLLGKLGADYDLATSEQVSFSRLREQPVVLIGALSNRWSVKAIQRLRYRICAAQDESGTYRVEDSHTSLQLGSVNASERLDRLSKDYSLVAHFLDPMTGQPTWLIAGVGTAGTMAASEFMSSEPDLQTMLQQAPPDWNGVNFQAVLESEMVDGMAGKPRMIAADFW